MWHDIIRKQKKALNVSNKWIADKAKLPERTVSRIISGETPDPSLSNVCQIAYALDLSLDDLFPGSSAILGGKRVKETLNDYNKLSEEYSALRAEYDLLKAEKAVQDAKVVALSAENDMLRLKLEHKEEIIALHNYYNKLKSNN